MKRTDKILSFFPAEVLDHSHPDKPAIRVRERYEVTQTRNSEGTITYKLDLKAGQESVHEKHWTPGFVKALQYFQSTGSYLRHFVKRPGKEFEITLTA